MAGRSSSRSGEKARTTPHQWRARRFSVLNDTFEDDMDNSHADYIELSLQVQYNSRSRGE